MLDTLTPEMSDKLHRFRERALERGIPSADVDRWVGLARRCAVLSPKVEGPVVGHFGDPVRLPPDVPLPSAWPGMPQHLIASVDLAALPWEATGLPLPPDGHLLLFAHPNFEGPTGNAVYLPAGTVVEERQVEYPYEPGELLADVDFDTGLRGELRMRQDVSLPDYSIFDDDITIDAAEHPRAEELREAWWDVSDDGPERLYSQLNIGGYPMDHDGFGDPVLDCARSAQKEAEEQGPAASGKPEQLGDWVLLAEWRSSVMRLEFATMYWAIRRQDIADRRFDRASATMYANP